MYYPKQIPNFLNKEFKDNITYREYQFKELEKIILCIWTMSSEDKSIPEIYNMILPDGCIDLIIDLEQGEIGFSAYNKATEKFLLKGEINYIGVRFKPGIFYSIYQYDCKKVMNHLIPFETIEKKHCLKEIYHKKVEEQINILKIYLLKISTNFQENIFTALVNQLYSDLSNQQIENLSTFLGYSSRQTNRLFLRHYGISPKSLINILRLHKCLSQLINEPSSDLTEFALNCGFYDQSHFINEIVKYCGISPTKILERFK